MKKISIVVLVVILGAAAFFAGCSREKKSPVVNAGKTLYTCAMHPQVIQDHPGNCPICGMKLVPIRNSTGAGSNADSAVIEIDPVTIQNMNLQTAVVTNGPLRRIVRSVGAVDFNESSVADVTTKFKGWIEKLYVSTTGEKVHRGEPLFEIYSPELYSAQVEYLLALRQSGETNGVDPVQSSALTKLQFFDISQEQIAELKKTKQPKKALQVTAPSDGFVIEKNVVEGQMVDAGAKLYRLADLGTVWVIAQIYEQDLALLRLGQEATVKISYLPDREFRGRVTYIYPTIDEKTRTAKVRMEFHNPGYFLKPGMFATVELRSELAPSVLLVPDVAVLRSGERNTVFVALGGGKFEPREVVLGPRAENNKYEVLSGLSEGERVVTSAQFMLDSESRLREAVQKMTRSGDLNVMQHAVAAPAVIHSHPAESSGGTNIVAYICPMPEHVAIRYDHPGVCPICGMTLVPVSQTTLDKIQPGGEVEYYVCPMTDACPTPGHGAVHYDKPGKCPVCGMTLIPVMKARSETNSAVSMPAHQQ
ncbi:MAG TPA: efflux RND transporter periplasmic adaptor subunit [Verrucomicrobiae bacterium]|nr:efflux RND transporter periplasmic adaptor subunit [Verrucomicrobiae bacterium]